MKKQTQNIAPASWWQRSKQWLGAGEKKSYLHDKLEGYTTYMTQVGKPVWSPRSYDKFAEEGYRKNVIAYRSISMIAQAAASVEWKLFAENEGAKRQLHQHPILKLLNRPNPTISRAEFMESMVAYRMIHGNCFVLASGPEGGAPMELHTLRPDQVQVVAGKGKLPQAYDYKVGNQTMRYPVHPVSGESNMLHWKHFHPTNDWYGMSPIEAAAYSVDQHNQAGQWNQALLQNGAKPTGALVVKERSDGSGGYLNDEQFNRIRSQIDSEYTGAANAGRPLLLEGGLEWKEMSLSPKDMDFIESKHSSARDIALAFGVPPQLLGIPGDNSYSNMVEARYGLWEETILPLLDHLQSSLNNWLVKKFDQQNMLSLRYDTENISALTPRRERVWKRLQTSDFMTVNEKREAVGLPAIEGGDQLL